jgi:hypothetical protein
VITRCCGAARTLNNRTQPRFRGVFFFSLLSLHLSLQPHAKNRLRSQTCPTAQTKPSFRPVEQPPKVSSSPATAEHCPRPRSSAVSARPANTPRPAKFARSSAPTLPSPPPAELRPKSAKTRPPANFATATLATAHTKLQKQHCNAANCDKNQNNPLTRVF